MVKPFESDMMLVKAMLCGYAKEDEQEAILKGFISCDNDILYITEPGDDKRWKVNPVIDGQRSVTMRLCEE